MTRTEAVDMVLRELAKAQRKHPDWPRDRVIGVAIMVEEAGEAIKAALDLQYKPGPGRVKDLRVELAHTAAAAIRNLLHLDDPFFDAQNPRGGGKGDIQLPLNL